MFKNILRGLGLGLGLGATENDAGLEPNAWGDTEIFKREPIETGYQHVGRKKDYYHTVPLFEVEEAGGSNLGGSTVNMANYRILAKMDHPQIVRLYGGYGSYGIVLRLDMGPLPEELLDIVSRLADYPVIDEDVMYETEQEVEDEAWENYGRSDWERELREAFDSDVVDELTADQLDKLWYDLRLSWRVEFESGGSAYFNFDEAIEKLADTNPNLVV